MSKIIYTQENGVVAVVHPTDQSLKEMTIEEIAQRVVPVGVTYSIVDDSVITSLGLGTDPFLLDSSKDNRYISFYT